MKRFIIPVLLSCALLGCGVKPGAVEPPNDQDYRQFPSTYPLPTDLVLKDQN